MQNSKNKPIGKHQISDPAFVKRFVYRLTYGDVVILPTMLVICDGFSALMEAINARAEHMGAIATQSINNRNEVEIRIEIMKNEIGDPIYPRKKPILEGVIPVTIAIVLSLIIGYIIGKNF